MEPQQMASEPPRITPSDSTVAVEPSTNPKKRKGNDKEKAAAEVPVDAPVVLAPPSTKPPKKKRGNNKKASVVFNQEKAIEMKRRCAVGQTDVQAALYDTESDDDRAVHSDPIPSIQIQNNSIAVVNNPVMPSIQIQNNSIAVVNNPVMPSIQIQNNQVKANPAVNKGSSTIQQNAQDLDTRVKQLTIHNEFLQQYINDMTVHFNKEYRHIQERLEHAENTVRRLSAL
jgi:hypothetical protein